MAGFGGGAILKSGGTLNIPGSSLAPGLMFFISVTQPFPVLGSVTEDRTGSCNSLEVHTSLVGISGICGMGGAAGAAGMAGAAGAAGALGAAGAPGGFGAPGACGAAGIAGAAGLVGTRHCRRRGHGEAFALSLDTVDRLFPEIRDFLHLGRLRRRRSRWRFGHSRHGRSRRQRGGRRGSGNRELLRLVKDEALP